MKKCKHLGGLSVLLMCLLIAGCGTAGTNEDTEDNLTVSEVLNQLVKDTSDTYDANINETVASAVETLTENEQTKGNVASEPEDDLLDLTILSSTMVYSEVYNMVSLNTDDYIGRKIKVNGTFALGNATEEIKELYGTEYYYFVVIADATACCQQGIEFVLVDDPLYPEGYPEPGTEITLTGTFENYYEGENQYFHIADAVLE